MILSNTSEQVLFFISFKNYRGQPTLALGFVSTTPGIIEHDLPSNIILTPDLEQLVRTFALKVNQLSVSVLDVRVHVTSLAYLEDLAKNNSLTSRFLSETVPCLEQFPTNFNAFYRYVIN